MKGAIAELSATTTKATTRTSITASGTIHQRLPWTMKLKNSGTIAKRSIRSMVAHDRSLLAQRLREDFRLPGVPARAVVPVDPEGQRSSAAGVPLLLGLRRWRDQADSRAHR